MGGAGSLLVGSSASMEDSCPWTEVSASNTQTSNTQQVSLNRQHLQGMREYDRSVVSVGRKIAEGGQGCVYEAKFHLPYSFKPVSVVVKKFKPFEGVSQGHFPREIFSMKGYFLCLPHGFYFDGNSLCIIMRRFSCDLRATINSQMKALRDEGSGTCGPPFTEAFGRFIIWQLAMGLKSLHELGVYHGDLKAANILLLTRSENDDTSALQQAFVTIADFERSEGVVSTAFWRAPEVLQSLRAKVPLSKEQWLLADIYSFGMVCYEVLTGMIPFQGHPLPDYDLVLNGGRPELPDHVLQSMRDLILRCWHADPHSRPNWSEIIEVVTTNDDPVGVDDPTSYINKVASYINNLERVESLSFESLMHESKQLVRDLTALHENDSNRFRREFMPYYWASEFLATAEDYASKFGVGSFQERSQTCSVQDGFERVKLLYLLIHQMYGVVFGHFAYTDLLFKGHFDMIGHNLETSYKRERLQVMFYIILNEVTQEYMGQESTNEYDIGTSWMDKLFYFHAIFKWVLWYEYADYGPNPKETMWTYLVQNSIIQALLLFLCRTLNTYIYVLAMITSEPILLGLQYGLYKAKGSNNILYRSSGERICRFQRAWMNCTKYKLVGIILSLSFVTLLTLYGWRGILEWILFPCVIINTPYSRRPILI